LRLTSALVRYLETHPVGEVFNPDNLFVLGPKTKRAPDVSFLRAERAKKVDENADIPGAPDLAVEVLSPTDTVPAVRRKIRQYFTAGAQCVWVVRPESRDVEVWRESDGPRITLKETDLLEAPDLLPGFSVRIGSLFV